MSRRRHGAGVAAALVALACWLVPAAAAAPQKHQGQGGPQGIEARAWIVIDGRTGDVIASHASKQKLPIASTTKLMTAWVAMHEMPLRKRVHAAPYDPIYGESLMNLRTRQTISVRDLLYGLILRSGNDAAHTLAIAAAGSQERFVAQMNRRAAALGLADTHYANPIGLDQKGNHSSVRDLATLTEHLLRMPAFAEIADSREAVLRSVHPQRRIETINALLEMAPWVTGVKTGHTFDAGYCLVGSGRRKGVELISVALGAPSDEARFSDALDLLEYGFSRYRHRKPVRAGEDFADATIRYSGGRLPLRAARTLKVGLRKGQRLQVKVRAPREVEGPIERGAGLGSVTVLVDGRRAGRVPLRTGRAVPEASAFDRARDFTGNNLIPFVVAAFVILVVAVLLCRRLTRSKKRRSATG